MCVGIGPWLRLGCNVRGWCGTAAERGSGRKRESEGKSDSESDSMREERVGE